ncbi:hypothetical protein AB4519_23505 [Vibrio splendidus]
MSSTKKGLALLGAGAALVAGHPELITASVSADGVQFGGIIGASAPIVLAYGKPYAMSSSNGRVSNNNCCRC